MSIQSLFVESETGQVELNWESLELVTSSEFVKEIKSHLHLSTFVVLHVQNLENFLTVYAETGSSQFVFTYFRSSNDFTTDRFSFSDVSKFIQFSSQFRTRVSWDLEDYNA